MSINIYFCEDCRLFFHYQFEDNKYCPNCYSVGKLTDKTTITNRPEDLKFKEEDNNE